MQFCVTVQRFWVIWSGCIIELVWSSNLWTVGLRGYTVILFQIFSNIPINSSTSCPISLQCSTSPSNASTVVSTVKSHGHIVIVSTSTLLPACVNLSPALQPLPQGGWISWAIPTNSLHQNCKTAQRGLCTHCISQHALEPAAGPLQHIYSCHAYMCHSV